MTAPPRGVPTTPAEVLRVADKLGWSARPITNGWRLEHPSGHTTILHRTLSDTRAWRNVLADLRRPSVREKTGAKMARSVNQSSILAALDLVGGVVESPHGKAVEELAALCIQVPGHTLGDNPPVTSRLLPTLETLVKSGTLVMTFRGRTRRVTKIARKSVQQRLMKAAATEPAPTPEPAGSISPPIRKVLTTLRALGGSIEDEKGFAGTLLVELAELPGSKGTLRAYLNRAETEGWIHRDTRGNSTRVFRIELTDQALAELGPVPDVKPAPPVEENTEEVVATAEPEPVETQTRIRPEDEDLVEKAALRLFEMCVERAAHYKQLVAGESVEVKALETELGYRDDAIAGYRAMEEELRLKLREAGNATQETQRRISRLEEQLAESEAHVSKIAHERDEWRRRYESLDGEVDEMFRNKSGRVKRKAVEGLAAVLDDLA